MRRHLASIAALLGLLQAFFMAPYQHVHVGLGHGRHTDHGESAIVHAHPYAFSVPLDQNRGAKVAHSHQPHVSVALDIFTPIAQGALLLYFQPESPARIFVPSESAILIEVTEPRGHDPPLAANEVPRAPPV